MNKKYMQYDTIM